MHLSRDTWSEARMSVAQRFGLLMIFEYLIAAALFGKGCEWKKCVYFIASAIKDISVIFL